LDLVEGPRGNSTPSEVPPDSNLEPPQRTSKKAPRHLDSTLSSWLRNMARLSRLIDRLHDLASSAQPQYRRQLGEQVDALRASFDTQQKRYTDFLKLTEEYASRYLLDISATILQQSSFLDALEERLDMAKELRGQAVALRTAYEGGTVKAVKDIRTKALSEPLPQDVDLLEEVDRVLVAIRRCFVEMDRFWVDEVRRVSKALQDCRRVDEEGLGRWKAFRASLEQTIASWTVQLLHSHPSFRLLTVIRIRHLRATIAFSGVCHLIKPAAPPLLPRSELDTPQWRAESGRHAMHDHSETRNFASVYAQSLALLCKMDNRLGALLKHVASWMAVLDALDPAPFEPTLLQLRKTSRVWLKRRKFLREMLVAAEGGQFEVRTRGNVATRLGSMVTRGMRALVSFS
ncbi:hypothetical protein BC834DRAFT_897608, partial [Gloeopeniophorella convolvens]